MESLSGGVLVCGMQMKSIGYMGTDVAMKVGARNDPVSIARSYNVQACARLYIIERYSIY